LLLSSLLPHSGTALLAAAGSTVLLNYCVTPYVHSITTVDDSNYTAMTANLFGMRTTTDFTLDQVMSLDAAKLNRPFANFVANGTPMYIHGEVSTAGANDRWSGGWLE